MKNVLQHSGNYYIFVAFGKKKNPQYAIKKMPSTVLNTCLLVSQYHFCSTFIEIYAIKVCTNKNLPRLIYSTD